MFFFFFLRDANWPKLNALQQLAYKKDKGEMQLPSGFKRHLELCGHFSVKSRKLEEIRILLVRYLLFYSHAYVFGHARNLHPFCKHRLALTARQTTHCKPASVEPTD